MAKTDYQYRLPETDARFPSTFRSDEGFPGTFRVGAVVPASRSLGIVAQEFQTVMLEAWTVQFEGQFTEEQIRETVNPDDKAKVDAQYGRLRLGGQGSEEPTYVHAWIEVPKISMNGTARYVVGVGKALRVKQRFLKPTLADVSNVFVRPTAPEFNLRVQGRGVGSAILHSMLDHFPENMPTVVYDFEFNNHAVEWLSRLGFSADKSWPEEYFGQTVEQTKYDGPPTGEVVETLEAKKPWLKKRVAVPQCAYAKNT